MADTSREHIVVTWVDGSPPKDGEQYLSRCRLRPTQIATTVVSYSPEWNCWTDAFAAYRATEVIQHDPRPIKG